MSDGARERVRLSQEQLVAAFTAARVGYSVIELVDPDDPETWIIQANNLAASMNSQTDLADVVGQRFLAAFPAVRGTPFIDWYRKVLVSGESMELPEIRYGDAQVPDSAFRVWLDPLPGRAVLGQYVNVTLQRQAEGRLRALNATLEQQVAERTAALAASRRMLREITYAAAHDLQTPLRHVLLLSDPEDPDPETDARGVLDHIHHAARLIRERLAALLVYTHADRREGARAVTLAAEVDRVMAGHAALIEASGAHIETTVQPATVRISVDALRTALEQLLSNALIFHAEGQPPVIRLSVAVDDSTLVVEVRDEGVGIAPDQHDAIFQAFYRVHRGEQFPGAGVGLAAARVAVEAGGGTLTVDSALGRGARFTVRLPISPAPPEEGGA